MGNIVVLDELTINKIAAGEVIERPASIVKEMVENSIDAGATSITVEIQNGGISEIRISDNGKGISKDDLELAFERHSTSKIRIAEDLESVKSMGFRGEALASIAAISKVEMITKTQDEDTGSKIIIEAGKVLEKCEASSQIGTTIKVSNLFFNTPVRYKFLKKDFTELGYIEDVMTRLALVNINISFKLINAGKTILQTTGDDNLKNVVYSIYGKDVAEGIVPVDYRYENLHISGMVGKPEITRSNRGNQLFFVNKRYVKDRTLSSATEQAFKGLLPIGKFGFVIINIEMEPSEVDVNVHPAKLEVRFTDDNKVFRAVYHAIKESLLKQDLVPNTEKEEISTEEPAEEITQKHKLNIASLFRKNHEETKKENDIKEFAPEQSEEKEENNFIEQIYKNKTLGEENIASEPITKDIGTPTEEQVELATKLLNMQQNMQMMKDELKEQIVDNAPKLEETQILEKIQDSSELKLEENNSFDEMYIRTFGKLPNKEDKKKVEEVLKADDVIQEKMPDFIENKEKPQYTFLGIAFSTYIIIQMDKDLYLVDQHAAHERILYEKVKENFYKDGDKESQLLLLPDVITLTHKEMDITRENIELFEQAGFTLEEFGDNTIKLTGVPDICINLDTKELFLETLDEINTVALTAKQEKEEKFIETVACKAAIKANMSITKEEVEKLMEKLLILPNPFTCPHGRPTAIRMTKQDLEKKFLRR